MIFRMICFIISLLGFFIMLGSGLCSLTVAYMSLRSFHDVSFGQLRGLLSGAMLLVLFGGVPFAFGFALFWMGKRAAKNDSAGTPAAPMTDPESGDEEEM